MDFKLSVVVPAYNEQENLPVLVEKLVDVLRQADIQSYEIILVDDGSTDETLAVMKALHDRFAACHYIELSRNFGHQYALKAGLDAATGDAVISMDADLQHPVELIPDLIRHWQAGHDIVYTIRRDSKKETLFKRLTSRLYYKIFGAFSGLNLPAGSADFRLMSRAAADVLKQMPERVLFLRGLVFWMGFKQQAVVYDPAPRFKGKSHYNLKRMVQLAIAGVTAFSVKPLRLAVYVGLITAALGVLFTGYVLYMRLVAGTVISGWASVMSVILILGGCQLFVMGLIGEYVGLTFMEAKKRPSYIVRYSSLAQRKNHKRGNT